MKKLKLFTEINKYSKNYISLKYTLKQKNKKNSILDYKYKLLSTINLKIEKQLSNNYSIFVENFESQTKNKGYGSILLNKTARKIRIFSFFHRIKINKIYGFLNNETSFYWPICIPMYIDFGNKILGKNSKFKILHNKNEITSEQLIKKNKGGKFEITKFNSK